MRKKQRGEEPPDKTEEGARFRSAEGDPLGMWTGRPADDDRTVPEQDPDDL